MENGKIIVSGVGCCLIDRIYNNIDFNAAGFQQLLSKSPGDGGLQPGKLEFEENLEHFAGKRFPDILIEQTNGRASDNVNIGGPCIVALINAAQLSGDTAKVYFYGCHGDDEVGRQLIERLAKVPIDLTHYRQEKGAETASTTVFSDPNYDEGHGERIFVNTIGASWKYRPEELDEKFFSSDVCVFGATAIVPPMHQALDTLLRKAKQNGALTVVNTVFDSLNERKYPDRRWPLGDSDESYPNIDILITDKEEALRLSGTNTIADAMAFFKDMKVGAALVTNGSKDTYIFAQGERLSRQNLRIVPVSQQVKADKVRRSQGDTTGCGDNFAGGVIYSIVKQLHEKKDKLDIYDAALWGTASGGFACFYIGGTYYETQAGEKYRLVKPYYDNLKAE